jgi:hypothetical protein
MKVKNLKPSDYNPRVISEARLKMLKKSLDEFGDLSGVVFNVETEHLVGGHQRLKHLDPEWRIVKEKHSDKTGTTALGYIETPTGRLSYREVKWVIEKEIQANIAANNHGGEFEKNALAKLFKKMGKNTDANLLGFEKNFFKNYKTEKTATLKEGFEVVVECDDEAEMKQTYELLQEEGYQCRLLIF